MYLNHVHMVQKSKQHRKFHGKDSKPIPKPKSPKQPLKNIFCSISEFSFPLFLLLSFSFCEPPAPRPRLFPPFLPSFLSCFTFALAVLQGFAKSPGNSLQNLQTQIFSLHLFYTKDACCPSTPSSF